MTKDEQTALALGQMVSRMIADLRKQAGTETGYARRTVTFPGGKVQLFIVNDSRLSDLFDAAAAKAYDVATARSGLGDQLMTREERDRQAVMKDRRLQGPAIAAHRSEKPKQGAKSAPAAVSGQQTTLGDLLDAELDRFDARRA